MDEQKLIKGCIKEDAKCQEKLYELFSDRLFMVCLRYASNRDDAKDIFQEGFIRILDNIKQFNNSGSLAGWMCRVMANTALSYYRQRVFKYEAEWPEHDDFTFPEPDALSRMTEKELLDVINELPDGYRIVFNMYAIDGFSHEEIAEQLGISKGTSRSQLKRARTLLQSKLKKLMHILL